MKEYKTKNFNLATYLHASGVNYIGVSGDRIKEFLFADDDDKLLGLISKFNSKKAKADVWDIIMSQKILKGELYK